MSYDNKITVYEIDNENNEVCGKRIVLLTDRVIPIVDPAKDVYCLRLDVKEKFTYIDGVSIGWFSHEEETEYELANRGRFYVEVLVIINDLTSDEYYRAWDVFRKLAIDRLTHSLKLSSWGFGKRIHDRRGQDIFVIEIDWFEGPCWNLYLSVLRNDTYGTCLATVESIEQFIALELVSLIKKENH